MSLAWSLDDLLTFGMIGGARVRFSRPSQSNPWYHLKQLVCRKPKQKALHLVTVTVEPVLANVEDAVLLVAESLGGVLLAELLYYGDGRLKHINAQINQNAEEFCLQEAGKLNYCFNESVKPW